MSDPRFGDAHNIPSAIVPVGALPGGREGVNFLRFSPDGRRLASSVVLGADAVVRNNTLHLWNIPAQKLEGEISLPERLSSLDIAPDWLHFAAASPPDGIHVRRLDRDPTDHVIDSRGDVTGVAFFPGGEVLLAGYADGYMRVIDAARGQQWAEFRPVRSGPREDASALWEVHRFAIAPNGVRMAIVAADTRAAVQVWKAGRGVEDFEWVGGLLDPEHSVFDLCFSPDGRWLAITDGLDNIRHDVVRVYDATSLEPAMVLVVPQDIPRALAFSGDGRYLAVAGAAGTVWLWNTQTWQQLESFAAHVDAWDHRQGAPEWQIDALVWSAATGVLATAGMDPLETRLRVPGESYTGPIKYTIKLWQLKTPGSVARTPDADFQR